MIRQQYEAIVRCLHSVDNDLVVIHKTQHGYSPIDKIEWLVNEQNSLYAECWHPEQNLTVNEMIVRYMGKRSPIRHYLKNKPCRYGLKCWTLANAKSKFVQKSKVYCGKEESLNAKDEALVGYKVVMRLLEGLEDKGHIVTYDKFFTSPKLFWDLLLKGIGATGTTKTNRKGWPQALTLAKEGPERGDIHWRMHTSNLLATVTWYDNKPVSLLSTTFSPIHMNDDVFVKR